VNPFHRSLEDNFRGERVRVTSNDGETYEGWVERMHHHDRHVVLRDATHLDTGDDVGAVMLAHADVLEVIEPTSRIEAVAVDTIEPAPYHAAEFDAADNRDYIAEVRDRQFVGSFPVARERYDGTLEVVEGHKRLWACKQAGVDEHPVEVVDVDDWAATRRFVADHLPDEEQVRDDGITPDGYYGEAAIEATLESLADRWGERALDLDRVAFNARRLDVDVQGDEVSGAEDDEPELTCDVDGCDYSTTSDRGLSNHQARVHSDEGDADQDDDATTLEERIVDVLDEHGELPSSEIKLLLETSSEHYRNVLQSLRREGRVATRQDPDDRRRNLYRLVDEADDPTDSDEAGTPTGSDEEADLADVEDEGEDLVDELEEDGFDLAQYGVDADSLVDALEGAQTIHHVERDLRISREETTEIIAELGLLEKISTGCAPIPRREARTAVEGVA